MFITKSNVIWDCCVRQKRKEEKEKTKKEDFSFFPSFFHSFFFFFSSQESLGSSFTLELQNINMMMEGYYSAAFSAFSEEMSLFSSATTTGYLQDAIAEWSNRSCKRRRNCWDYNEDTVAVPSDENFGSCFTSYNLLPDNNPSTSFGNDIKSTSTVDHSTETTREPERLKNISSLCSSFYLDSATSCSKKGDKRRKVVYPFDMVKPGGIEGDVTLNDINERILMPPRRPIRHPVGDMAGNPCVFMSGLGPSGKAVVALTRIRTQGRGTVIIIRTRG